MFDSILGIPLHPLVVHAVVVLVPLAAVGTIAISARPRWRSTYGWLVVGLSAISLISVPVAVQSGKNLKEELQLGGPALEKVVTHQDLGGWVIWLVAPMWVLGLALVIAERAGWRGVMPTVLAVLGSLAALGALVLVVLTGHAGANAVWNPGG